MKYTVHCSYCGYIGKDNTVGSSTSPVLFWQLEFKSKMSAILEMFNHVEAKGCENSVCTILYGHRKMYSGCMTFDGGPYYVYIGGDCVGSLELQRIHKHFVFSKSIKNAGKEEMVKIVEEMLHRID